MTYREAWEIIKPLVKAESKGDRELTLAYCIVSQAVEAQESRERHKRHPREQETEGILQMVTRRVKHEAVHEGVR